MIHDERCAQCGGRPTTWLRPLYMATVFTQLMPSWHVCMRVVVVCVFARVHVCACVCMCVYVCASAVRLPLCGREPQVVACPRGSSGGGASTAEVPVHPRTSLVALRRALGASVRSSRRFWRQSVNLKSCSDLWSLRYLGSARCRARSRTPR